MPPSLRKLLQRCLLCREGGGTGLFPQAEHRGSPQRWGGGVEVVVDSMPG